MKSKTGDRDPVITLEGSNGTNGSSPISIDTLSSDHFAPSLRQLTKVNSRLVTMVTVLLSLLSLAVIVLCVGGIYFWMNGSPKTTLVDPQVTGAFFTGPVSYGKETAWNDSIPCFQHNGTSCPDFVNDFNHLKVAKIRALKVLLLPVQEVSNLSITDTDFVYESRVKFRMDMLGMNAHDLGDTFADLDWTKTLTISNKSTARFNVLNSDPEFKDITYTYSPGAAYFSKLNSKESFQAATNLLRSLFGLRTLNLALSVGIASDHPTITAIISISGTRLDGLTELPIASFRKEQQAWCRCNAILRGKLHAEGDDRGICFEILKTRTEFQMLLQLDDQLCSME